MTLANRTIALAEGRQIEDLARMLEKEGARTLRCPMLSILDHPDEGPVLAWLQELVQSGLDYLVLLTGEGLNRLIACADRHGLREPVIAALGRACLVTRGPKPVRALKEIGLVAGLVAPVPTTPGVVDALRTEALGGKRVGIQLYPDSNPLLVEFLAQAGAVVRTVLPYVYAPASDADHVGELIQQMAAGAVDALIFTSSPQVDRLFKVARERDALDLLRQGLEKTCVAAVGPVIADTLHDEGVRVDIRPEQGFVMKNLVQLIKKSLT